MKRLIPWIICTALLAALILFRPRTVKDPSWEQPAMSSLARITLTGRFSESRLKSIRRQIDSALENAKQTVSIWDESTEISRFNRHNSVEPFRVSAEFEKLVRFALDFSSQTGGAFDPTVKPLIDHWGFGPEENTEPLSEIMKAVGWKKVQTVNGSLVKAYPRLQLDLTAVADGFGADCAADALRQNGCRNFLIEVGGEIAAEGTNRTGNPWRVGIEPPEPGKAAGEEILKTVELSGKALATSGDYRNFKRRDDGTRYSHIIDPHTGKPAESDVASVTVIAARGTDADALATALCVMGSENGLRWLDLHPEFQAFFILHTAGSSNFTYRATGGFPEDKN